MRKFITTVTLSFIVLISINAQEASVEKSVFGFQLGTNPWNIYYDAKLADKISLHTEIGLGGEYYWHSSKDAYMFQPNIIVEPRYYYNLERRVSKGKKIAGNTGNYLGMMFDYIPDVYLNKNTYSRWTGVVAMPSYGIQRRVGKWFEYELV